MIKRKVLQIPKVTYILKNEHPFAQKYLILVVAFILQFMYSNNLKKFKK